MAVRLGLFAALPVFVALAAGAARAAQWERVYWDDSAGEHWLRGVSTPDGIHVFAAGFYQTNPGSMLPDFQPRVLLSTDGGRTFRPTPGVPTLEILIVPVSIQFLDTRRGYLAAGSRIHRTTDGGATWVPSETGVDIESVHFFDERRGIVVGGAGRMARTNDGGLTWTVLQSPTSARLTHQFWLDENRGWVAGAGRRTVRESPIGPEYFVPSDGVVLRTSDGGEHWAASAPVYDRGFEVLFFLEDGRTGWVASVQGLSADQTEAGLWVTRDGGATFADTRLPVQVGILQYMGIEAPISVARFVAMRWEDDLRGHLAGSAVIQNYRTGDATPEQQTNICRTVDFVTRDGGASWIKTNLSTVALQPIPPNDGELDEGILLPNGSGWLVGDRLAIWRTSTGDDPGPDGAPDASDAGGDVGRDSGPNGDGQTERDAGPRDAGNDGSEARADGGDFEPAGDPTSGCGCGSAGTPVAVATCVLLAFPSWSSRHRSRRS